MQADAPLRTHKNPGSLRPHPLCRPYTLCPLCLAFVAGSALKSMTERDWRRRGFPVAVRESVRRLRRLRRLAFAQVGASCLSRLSYLSYLKIFTKTSETTAKKTPRMSVLSGLCGGSARTKKRGVVPPLATASLYRARSSRSAQTLCACCPHGERSSVGSPPSTHAAGRPTRAWDQSSRLRLPMATSTSVRS